MIHAGGCTIHQDIIMSALGEEHDSFARPGFSEFTSWEV